VIWLYIILAVVLLVGLFLLLRLRLRVVLDEQQKIVFVGLGRSGPEIDFDAKVARLKIAGITLQRIAFADLGDKTEPEETEDAKTRTQMEPEEQAAEEPTKPESPSILTRLRRLERGVLNDIWALLKIVPRATASFLIGIIRDSRLEELHGRIEAGLGSPDTTGRVYGYYCAVAGALPGSVGRFEFIPDWDGASFDGSMRMSIGLPLYRLLYRAIRLIWHLPIRKIWKLGRAKK